MDHIGIDVHKREDPSRSAVAVSVVTHRSSAAPQEQAVR